MGVETMPKVRDIEGFDEMVEKLLGLSGKVIRHGRDAGQWGSHPPLEQAAPVWQMLFGEFA